MISKGDYNSKKFSLGVPMRSGFRLSKPFSLFPLIFAIVCSLSAFCSEPTTLPPTVRVEIDSSAKLKVGAVVQAHTIEPFYHANQLVIPSGTVITGHVVRVSPVSRRERLDAMSHGDFTPLKTAKIQFDRLSLRDGEDVPLDTAPADQGSGILHFHRAIAQHPSVFHRAWATFVGQEHQAVSMVTAPGRMDRIKKFVYSQLPLHPQAIAANSQYDVTLLHIPDGLDTPDLKVENPQSKAGKQKLTHDAELHARLEEKLSSKTAKDNEPVLAVITEPLFDDQGKVEVPEGAVLRGRVLRAKPAKFWGRNGALRFSFNRVDFPLGFRQNVNGVPTGVDGSQNKSLKLDSEGGVTPDTNRGLMAPLALGLLATHSLADEDASVAGSATASNGFGLIVRIVAVASNSQTFGGVVGMITAGRSTYSRFIARGRNVVFPRNSEVEIEVGPLRTKPLPMVKP